MPEMTDWIDVSVTVRHGMPHWPDNPPIVLERVMDLGRGDDCNVSHLAMGVHSGTHMDGPVHFLPGAAGLDEMPLTATMGEARVIQIEHPRKITADEIRQHRLLAPAADPSSGGEQQHLCNQHNCTLIPAAAAIPPSF